MSLEPGKRGFDGIKHEAIEQSTRVLAWRMMLSYVSMQCEWCAGADIYAALYSRSASAIRSTTKHRLWLCQLGQRTLGADFDSALLARQQLAGTVRPEYWCPHTAGYMSMRLCLTV